MIEQISRDMKIDIIANNKITLYTIIKKLAKDKDRKWLQNQYPNPYLSI